MIRFGITAGCIFFATIALAAEPGSAENWPRFRGPSGTGESAQTGLPTQWSAPVWQVDLPVSGHSSPVVWADRIFLTGWKRAGDAVDRHIVCLDRKSGQVLWNEKAASGSGEKLHKMNSWATPSCVTDGERVVAFFGSGGLHCYSFDGKPMWSRQLGDFPGSWGVGASPIIVDDIVIQNCDSQGDSYLLAVNKTNGEDVWRTPRRQKPRGGWSTPIVIETDGGRELVLNGEFGVEAYEPDSGQPLWFCKGFNGRGTPAPAWGNGLLYMVNGKAGDVYAVRPGGKGDVTETQMQWHTERRGGRDLPSPVLTNNVLVVIGMAGIASGYDAKSGDELWKTRLGGKFSGSPVVSDGLIFVAAENGEVIIMKAGEQLDIVGRNHTDCDADEVVRSSLAISNGQLLMRSDKRLYCLGK